MSALFDSGTGNLASPWTISPIMELRQVPLMQTINTSISEYEWTRGTWGGTSSDDMSDKYDLLTRDLYDLKADWMYTAIIQNALNGPAPIWSKDDWSFVPVFLSQNDLTSAQDLLPRFEGAPTPANLTVETPAIRVTLDCSMIELAKNTSSWISRRNSTINSTGIESFYQLAPTLFHDLSSNQTTRVTAQGVSPQCCGNVTDDTVQAQTYDPAVIAYWTENWLSDGSSILLQGDNFTIKWIRGPAGFVEKPGYEVFRDLIFSEAPVMQALSCMPGFEASKAEVLVDLTSGIVQDYRILSMPVPEDVAWSDDWTHRNLSEKPQFQNVSNGNYSADNYKFYPSNVTTRLVRLQRYHGISDNLIAMASIL
jgi:hypothetical protein